MSSVQRPGSRATTEVCASAKSMRDNSKPHLFALIIAINDYKSKNIRPLRGAEADALSFKEYLENFLSVPPEQVKTLFNAHAKRSNIIRAFKQLEEDRRIQKGDPIVIFYAGHGTESAYSSWESGGPRSKIQMVVPYDYSLAPGEEIPCIPDRTIGALIGHIAKSKGDNITVIFDCCNSSSGTRSSDSLIIPRSISVADNAYDSKIDETILDDGSRSLLPSSQFEHASSKTHVLIAACGSSELAMETNGRGNFSVALLTLLRTVSPDKLTYADILTHMDHIPGQNPQCEGANRNRVLFDGKIASSQPPHYFIMFRLYEGVEQLILDAGAAHGITAGAEFRVFVENDVTALPQREYVGLTVDYTMAFISVMKYPPNFTLRQPCRVVQTRLGLKEDARLYVPVEDPFRDLFKQACATESEYRSLYSLDNITLVDSPEDPAACIHVHTVDNKITFKMMDGRVTKHGFSHQFRPIDADLDLVACVLGQIAHFYRTLNRAKSNSAISGRVEIEFRQLQDSGEFDESGAVIYEDFGQDLCQNNRLIDLVVDDNTPYGLKIINKTSWDLYAYLFYFDNSDLSITSLYETATAAKGHTPDYSLTKTDGTLTVGYGSGGVEPFYWNLGKDQKMDVGFFKLFLSIKAVNLSDFQQTSPFSSARSLRRSHPPRTGETWDSILVTVVQRKHRASVQ